MEIEIRLIRESDLPAALRLKELAHWNQTDKDWKRLIHLEPNGCFCATRDGEVIATTTTTTYGRELAWVGMVLVDPEHRRQGIGTKLMHVAMEYLSKAGLATIKLDATPAGRPVYEHLGFKEESLIERWEGTAEASTTTSVRMESGMRSDILALDRKNFGTDRTLLIDKLFEDSSIQPVVATDSAGRLTGYALARRGTNASYVGPLVADNNETASNLMDGVLDQMQGQRAFIDLNTDFDRGRQILSERGFVKQRDLIRMFYGRDSRAGLSSAILAIAGPEVG